MAFINTLNKGNSMRLIDEIIATQPREDGSSALTAYCIALGKAMERTPVDYRLDELGAKLAELATCDPDPNQLSLRELPDRVLAETLKHFSAGKVISVLVAMQGGYRRSGFTESMKVFADAVAEENTALMQDREGKTFEEFSYQGGVELDQVTLLVDAFHQQADLVKYMSDTYPDLYVSHLVEAIHVVENCYYREDEFVSAVLNFPELQKLHFRSPRYLDPLISLARESMEDVVDTINEYSKGCETREDRGIAALHMLKIAKKLNSAPLKGTSTFPLECYNVEAFDLALQMGIPTFIECPIDPYESECGYGIDEARDDVVTFWEDAAEVMKKNILNIAADDPKNRNPHLSENMPITEIANVLHYARPILSQDGMVILLHRLSQNGMPYGFFKEDVNYWLDLVRYIYESDRSDGPGSPNADVLELIFDSISRRAEDLKPVLDWMDETPLDSYVKGKILGHLGGHSYYYSSDEEAAGSNMNRLLKEIIKSTRAGYFPHSRTPYIVKVGQALDCTELSTMVGTVELYEDIKCNIKEGYFWFSNNAVDREEKIHFAMGIIGNLEIDSVVFEEYPEEKLKGIMDYYGWEDTPEFNSFVRSLPATTTLSDLSELYGK